MITIYTTPLSANGRKVLAVARHLDIEADVRLVNVYAGEGRTPEYLAINPLGKIPTLVDGDRILPESNAILLYLSEVCADFALSSADPARRAEIASWLFWEASLWQPALSAVLAETVGHLLVPAHVPAASEPPDWCDPKLAPLLPQIESALGRDRWILGSELTLADFAIAGMAMYFRATGFPFGDFPRLARWYAQVEELPAWRDTCVAPFTRA